MVPLCACLPACLPRCHVFCHAAGYDGPGECLRHVVGHGQRLYPVPPGGAETKASWLRIDASEFVSASNRGGGTFRHAQPDGMRE